jgi:UDP-glucose 4-epimerase|tara:strand:+ start:305 stop:1147 length:843 start_codon:yes stop_codon:yes gene_type:complete
MRVLVTGGAGFIGTNLIKRLLSDGHEVISIDNYSTGKRENEQKGCKYYKADITDFYDFRFFAKHADVIFHMAAIARIQPSFERPRDYIKTNFQGTYNLINYCNKENIPIIYAGTSSHHAGKFKNPYTFSKSLGEEVIELYQEHFDLKASIVRFYNVYGPYQLTEGGYTTLIGKWINNIKKGDPCEIYGDGTKRRDFTHVDDIVNGLIAIWNREAYGNVFELGYGKNYSVKEVADMFNITPVYKENKPGEAQETLCTDKTAHKILDWQPKINLIQYIKETI